MIVLRELFQKDFGVDLPISGGTGNSLDHAIIIHRMIPNDYAGTEYAILKYMGIGRGVTWKRLGQELIKHDGRVFDKLKIEVTETTEAEIITTIENYYFDITECFAK